MYADNQLSLIERKKLQWAKEREELAGLCAPWGPVKETQNYDKTFDRNKYTGKFSMTTGNEYLRKNVNTPRRSSLPPLYKNQFNSNDKYERERDVGGETSGYGSDNPNNSPEYPQIINNWNQSGYESSSSYRDDRPKWGDKGLGIGKFWESKEDTTYGKTVVNEPPGWVKRGLESDTEIVVSNTSPAESPEQDYGEAERPYTSTSSNQNRSYIRGQNIPLDQAEIAERERRRLIALAHHEAIKQQLEEKEQKRKEERNRRIREEKEEELRIEREQEIERKRKEYETKLQQEKQERERKRKEALTEALELAEKEAKLEKMKQRMIRQNINYMESITEKDKTCNEENNNENEADDKNINSNLQESIKASQAETPPKDLLNNEVTKNNIPANILKENCQKNLISQRENNNNEIILSPRQLLNNNTINQNLCQTPQVPQTPRLDNLAIILQTHPLEQLQNNLQNIQNLQYAVLMPTFTPATSTAIPIAIPIPLNNETPIARTENRILTPTQYRNKNKNVCDSSTQTEYTDFSRIDTTETNKEKYLREKLNNLELQQYECTSRKESRRSRNEERARESVEERPKWGANRPPTRYLKQSEKDPLYQRRKMKKMRDTKMYDDKNSSDESPTATPRSYRKKVYSDKRHQGRALWNKNDLFARNLRMYQTEIVPLESDKEQIYYKQNSEHYCYCCHCRCNNKKYCNDNVKVDILKIEHSSPTNSINKDEISRSNTLPDCIPTETTNDILDKLSSLHNSLLSKQEQWENSPRTPSLSSNK